MKVFSFCVLAALCFTDNVMTLATDHPCSYFITAPMENFDKTLYAGEWYMHQLYDWGTSANYNCYVQIRTPTTDGNHNLAEILVDKQNIQPRLQIEGKLTFDQPGKGHYVYTSTSNSYTGSFDILATDYINYGIEWNCVNNASGGGSKCAVYVLSRTPIVTLSTQKIIDNFLDSRLIDRDSTKLRTVDITSCPSEFLPGGKGGLIEGILGLVAGLLGAALKILLG